jgi:aerobic-type carbon monoxide dehydrogenase small subunit (CoxS/CutS family)
MVGLRMKEEKARPVRFWFDNEEVEAFEGETVAAALVAAGIRGFGRNRATGARRGIFCAMGLCQECIVLMDGHVVEACRLPVCAGLEVRSV